MKQKLTLSLTVVLFSLLMASAMVAAPNPTQPSKMTENSETALSKKIHFSDNYSRDLKKEFSGQGAERLQSLAPTTGANGEIRVPSGEAYDYLYSYYMIDAWGESYSAGKPVHIYLDKSDNSVYLEDFLDDYMGDCYYVSGKLKEGDLQNGILEIDARKAVYYSWGEWLMLIVAEYNETKGEFFVLDDTSFNLTIKDGVISNDSIYLALASINDDTDVYWLLTELAFDPIDINAAQVAEIPSSATLNHYYQTVNGSDESIVCVYKDGNDFYFNNLFDQDLTFKGVLDSSNKIAIEMPQLVKKDDEFVYVNTYYSLGNDEYKPGAGETIYFDYDSKTGDISYADGAAIALLSGNKVPYSSYLSPYSTIDLVKFTADEEPTIVPSSATQRLYAMSTGYDEQGNHKAGLMKIAREGNTVYFMRIDNNNYDVVLKGELDPATNKVTVQLSQIVGIRGSNFLGVSLAKQSIVLIEDTYDDDYNEIRYVVDDAAPATITIDYDPVTEIFSCNDVLAIINAQRHTVSISLIKPTYTPVEEVAVIPATAETNQYVFSKDGETNSSTVVEIARDGDDFYFIHPAPTQQVEKMVIHGVLNSDGQVEIAVPQLIAYGASNQGVFMRSGTWERVSTPEDADVQMRFWGVFTDDDVKAIYLDYDEGLNEFVYNGNFSLVQFNDNKELVKATSPYYKTYVLGAYEPAAPTDLELYGKEEDYWGNGQRYRLDFVIPCMDVDGKYFPYDNISFRLYFDDEPFVFTPEDYPMTFTEDIIDVPFNHPASSEIPHPIWNANMRQVYLYNLPKEKIGVQSCYTYEGESVFSKITYMEVKIDDPEGGLDSLTSELPVNVEYFDLMGRPASGSESGLLLVKKTYSNGFIVTEKVKN